MLRAIYIHGHSYFFRTREVDHPHLKVKLSAREIYCWRVGRRMPGNMGNMVLSRSRLPYVQRNDNVSLNTWLLPKQFTKPWWFVFIYFVIATEVGISYFSNNARVNSFFFLYILSYELKDKICVGDVIICELTTKKLVFARFP